MDDIILWISGSSEIFVYNYEGRAPTTKIGRVFVDDPDDWDLPDKTFRFKVCIYIHHTKYNKVLS